MTDIKTVEREVEAMDEKGRIEYIDNLPLPEEDKARIKTMVLGGGIRDSLTGLYTRGYFLAKVEDEIARFMRGWNGRKRAFRIQSSLGMIDADHFGDINGNYGHTNGDTVLNQLGCLARDHFRDADIVGRYGGEEIGVLFPDSGDYRALKALERFRERVPKELSYTFDNINTGERESVVVTISGGLAPMQDVGELRILHGERGRDLLCSAASIDYNCPIFGPFGSDEYRKYTGMKIPEIVYCINNIRDTAREKGVYLKDILEDEHCRSVLARDILIGRADKALYMAKNNGRNRVEIYSPEF